MKLFHKEFGRYPLGIWFALIALSLTFLAWIIQAYSLIDWEGAIKFGFQSESFTGDIVERALADVEKGVAIADLLWAFPITIVAFIGLLWKKLMGFIAAMMVFAISIYFPLFYIFRESTSFDIVLVVIFLWAVPSLLGIYGLWVNRNLYIAN